jgi:choline kinase
MVQSGKGTGKDMPQVKKAVILAAGMGSRLNGLASPEGSKPMMRIAGMPLVRRILLQLQSVGVEEAFLVVGYRKEVLIRYLEAQTDLEIDVRFVHNDDYRQPNGISLLKARDPVGNTPFLLLMSDHLIATQILRDLLGQSLPESGVILAVDGKFPDNIDQEDATKVAVSDGRIRRIGKNIEAFTALDTGTFLCSPAIFDSMSRAAAGGDASLSAGMQLQADRGRLFPMDIGASCWQDIDTLKDRMHAEWIAFRGSPDPGEDVQPGKTA